MRFAIDVAFCDRELGVLHTATMQRHRLSRTVLRSKAVIEAPSPEAASSAASVCSSAPASEGPDADADGSPADGSGALGADCPSSRAELAAFAGTAVIVRSVL